VAVAVPAAAKGPDSEWSFAALELGLIVSSLGRGCFAEEIAALVADAAFFSEAVTESTATCNGDGGSSLSSVPPGTSVPELCVDDAAPFEPTGSRVAVGA